MLTASIAGDAKRLRISVNVVIRKKLLGIDHQLRQLRMMKILT